jgi:outer membrane protein, heavy metal efflux system
MKKAFLITIIIVLGYNLIAQNSTGSVLTEIEKNNTSLAAVRKNIDAEKIKNITGLTPQNPAIEFNYLWDSPASTGNRIDFSVTQSFDYPTAYRYKSQISGLKNEQIELEYKKQRMEILSQAREICVKLTYINAVKVELNNRLALAQRITDAYNTQFNNGEVGILEYNKARVNLLKVTKELENNEIERSALLSELGVLNGGNPVSFPDSVYAIRATPTDFDQWYTSAETNHPLLQWLKQEITISTSQVQLQSALNLPKFYGGFMSENIPGQHFVGLTFGLTVPLWENKHTVNYAKAKTIALEGIETDAKVQFYNKLKAAHSRVIALQTNLADYRKELMLYNNGELLEKAFIKGEISLTEYLYELSLFYEGIFAILELERDLNLAISELIKFQ